MLTNWEYIGDVNIEYGGYFVRHDLDGNGRYQYSDVIEVIDLESATGADGLTAVNFMSTFDFTKKKVQNVMSYTGAESFRGMGKINILNQLAINFCAYGYSDPWEDCYRRPSFLILVDKSYGPFSDKRSWDSWQPSKDETVIFHKKYDGDLEAYLWGEWL